MHTSRYYLSRTLRIQRVFLFSFMAMGVDASPTFAMTVDNIKQLSEYISKEMEDIKKKVDDYSKTAEELKGKISDVTDNLSKKVKDHQATNKDLENKISALNQRNTQNQKDLSHRQDIDTSFYQKITEIKTGSANAKEAYSELAGSFPGKETFLEPYKIRLDEAYAEYLAPKLRADYRAEPQETKKTFEKYKTSLANGINDSSKIQQYLTVLQQSSQEGLSNLSPDDIRKKYEEAKKVLEDKITSITNANKKESNEEKRKVNNTEKDRLTNIKNEMDGLQKASVSNHWYSSTTIKDKEQLNSLIKMIDDVLHEPILKDSQKKSDENQNQNQDNNSSSNSKEQNDAQSQVSEVQSNASSKTNNTNNTANKEQKSQ